MVVKCLHLKYPIDCNVPYRTGYQVILGVWTIYDTGNAFYQVIDANMKP
ncbi:MAG: lytic polysaccharide monooxygenase [Arsenophonus endosymbiont of Dermacentor nuttalli]